MKKNKFLCVVLTMAVAFTMVFAGTGSVFAAETTNGTDTIQAVNFNDTDTQADAATLVYTSTADYVKINQPEAGTLLIRFYATADSYARLYDAYGTQIGYGTQVPASASDTDYKYAYFTTADAGTYTLEMTSYGSSQASAALDAYYYPMGGTPTKGENFGGSSPNGKVAYYKIKATGNGYITVEFPWGYSDPASYQVRLFSSSKKALFKKGYEYVGSSKNYMTHIGVAKGTYFVGIKSTDPYYGLNLKFTKVSEKSGKTKGKAVKLSKGKTKKGIITASQSSKSGDWYKFTISKSQKVELDVSTLTSEGGGYGGLKVSLYNKNSSYAFGTENFYYDQASQTLTPFTYGMGQKLQAGTYYIKVQKYSDGNGYYKIKWQ